MPPRDASLPVPCRRRSTEARGLSGTAELQRGGASRKSELEKQREQLEMKKRKLMAIYDDENDPDLKAYLSAMQARSQTKTWANDESQSETTQDTMAAKKKTGPKQTGASHAETETEDLYQDMSKGLETDAVAELKKEKAGPLFANSNDAAPRPQDRARHETNTTHCSADVERTIAETGRLFVRNLSYQVKEEDLRTLFSKFGPVSEIHIPLTMDTKSPKGLAYILYVMPEHAVKAYRGLDRTIFQGRLIQIIPSKERPAQEVAAELGDEDSFKKKKAAKLRQSLSSALSWNTLFVNNDAVMECIAKRLGMKKGDLLSPESDDLATRVALAEVHVIQETKKYLAEEGVHFGDIEHGRARSKNVILVKNIPFSTKEEELSAIFSPFGSISRIVLPPTKVIALVEFGEALDARDAFVHLAYKKFKHVPLYLEYAPEGLLGPPQTRTESAAFGKEDTSAVVNPDVVLEEIMSHHDAAQHSHVLFIKNLSFDTQERDLADKLRLFKGFVRAKIQTRRDPKKPGQILSCGYGFAEFDSQSSAEEALPKLQHVAIDGHVLLFKFSQATPRKEPAQDAKGSTKIVVRNIPFEAVARNIRELFQPFGQVKRVRLPKKMDGTHRGFGFVEFSSRKDALCAFEGVRHVHLLGRHLVLEWASEEGLRDLERIREKTHQQKRALGLGGAKTDKLSIDEEERQSEDEL